MGSHAPTVRVEAPLQPELLAVLRGDTRFAAPAPRACEGRSVVGSGRCGGAADRVTLAAKSRTGNERCFPRAPS